LASARQHFRQSDIESRIDFQKTPEKMNRTFARTSGWIGKTMKKRLVPDEQAG
jgi:hypothetical protein